MKTKTIYAIFHWNYLLKEKIILEEKSVIITKRNLPFFWQVDQETITKDRMGIIKREDRLFWSNLIIESKGGSKDMAIYGLSKADAEDIKEFCVDNGM